MQNTNFRPATIINNSSKVFEIVLSENLKFWSYANLCLGDAFFLISLKMTLLMNCNLWVISKYTLLLTVFRMFKAFRFLLKKLIRSVRPKIQLRTLKRNIPTSFRWPLQHDKNNVLNKSKTYCNLDQILLSYISYLQNMSIMKTIRLFIVFQFFMFTVWICISCIRI